MESNVVINIDFYADTFRYGKMFVGASLWEKAQKDRPTGKGLRALLVKMIAERLNREGVKPDAPYGKWALMEGHGIYDKNKIKIIRIDKTDEIYVPEEGETS